MPWPQVQLVSAWIRLVLCLDQVSWEQKWKGIIQSMDTFIKYNKKLFCPTSFLPVSVFVVCFLGSGVVSRHVVYLTPKANCVLLFTNGVVATLRPYTHTQTHVRAYIHTHICRYIHMHARTCSWIVVWYNNIYIYIIFVVLYNLSFCNGTWRFNTAHTRAFRFA